MEAADEGADGVRVRRAEPSDAADLVRLRETMFASDGTTAPFPAGGAWQDAALRWYAGRLDDRVGFAAFVAEHPDAGVVACAVGSCDARAPGPVSPSGLRGHVSNVSTLPEHRRRGHARRCLQALLAWFDSDTPARVIDLNATPQGAGLYLGLGFTAPDAPALRRTRPGGRRGPDGGPGGGSQR